MKNTYILGCKVDNVSLSQSLKFIKKFIISKKPHQICTLNPEYLMSAQDDEELKYIINNSSLNTADGSGLIFASKYIKKPVKYKVTGVQLSNEIFKLASKNNYRIFLLGGKNNVANELAQKLLKRYPKIKIVGTHEGFPHLKPISKKIWQSGYKNCKSMDVKISKLLNKTNLKIIQKIVSANPDILLVAYGCPKQDKFIARYAQQLQIPVMIGVGGTFDYLSGRLSYPPAWIRNIHLEWFYRLVTQPWRFDRIITATIKFPLAVLNKKNHDL